MGVRLKEMSQIGRMVHVPYRSMYIHQERSLWGFVVGGQYYNTRKGRKHELLVYSADYDDNLINRMRAFDRDRILETGGYVTLEEVLTCSDLHIRQLANRIGHAVNFIKRKEIDTLS